MGMQGLEPVYRWQSSPGAQQEPTAPQQGPGHFLGPHSGQRGMWETVMGEFLVPRACKSTELSETS